MLSRFRTIRLLPRCTGRRFYSTDEVDVDPETKIYSREFADMKVEDFAELYGDNNSIKEQIEVILNEYEFTKFNSAGRVPTIIKTADMKLLLEEHLTPMNRAKVINYLFKREMDKRASKARLDRDKQEIAARRAVRMKEFALRGNVRTGLLTDSGEMLYGLWHNNLHCRIPDNLIKRGASVSRLMNASLFGRKLIFDFGYDEYMARHTSRNAVDQVQEAYGMNRFSYQDPFDLWFCNFDKGSMSGEYCVNKAIQNLYDGSMITVKEDCFTNHFDPSQLVYLTPNAKEPLGKVLKNDDIYIVGVYNDKGHQKPVSYRKALKLGIRARSLPLDTHVAWQGASKSLCINHVVAILLEYMANGGDWTAALTKHVPSRKIKSTELVAEEESRRLAKMMSLRKQTPSFNLRQDLDWT